MSCSAPSSPSGHGQTPSAFSLDGWMEFISPGGAKPKAFSLPGQPQRSVSRPNFIKLVEDASQNAPVGNSTISDVPKIIWQQRHLVLESRIQKKKRKGRRSWIGFQGFFLAELNPDGTVKEYIGTHAGENIADTLEEVVKDWGIGSRLGVALCDNASCNDVCLRSFFPRFIPQMDNDDVKARRIRCFCPILNLVAKAFLFGEESDAFEIQSDFYDDLGQYQEGLEHWRRKGPIGKLHNIVKFIRASQQRSEASRNIAQECDDPEDAEDFIFSEASSKELELRQNNATRWTSTYLMIKRAWEKQAEIRAYLLSLELGTASSQLPRQDHLTTDDWRLLNDIQHVLESRSTASR